MELNIEIIVQHDRPVSGDAIREILNILSETAETAAIRVINGLPFRSLNISADSARRHVHEACLHAFWLDSVEPGSSKFKGKIGGVILSIFIAATGGTVSRAAFDVIEDTQAYQTAKPHLVEAADEFTKAFVEALQKSAQERGERPDELEFFIELGEPVRIFVRPSRRQSDGISSGKP